MWSAGERIDVVSAAILGALQGLTEFLPVSSSGHVAIGALLFGLEDPPLTLSVALHAGTLLATVLVFRRDLRCLLADAFAGLRRPKELLASPSGRTLAAVVVATLPTVAIALALRDRVEAWGQRPWIVGLCLLASAAAVLTTRYGHPTRDELSLPQALVVGVAQGLAVLPGLSRSGSTIAAAMLLGMRGPAAFRFSFLLSLPAVAGAVLLEIAHPDALNGLPTALWIGGAFAALVGLGALLALRNVVIQGRLWAFALYLVPVGLGLLAWDLWRG